MKASKANFLLYGALLVTSVAALNCGGDEASSGGDDPTTSGGAGTKVTTGTTGTSTTGTGTTTGSGATTGSGTVTGSGGAYHGCHDDRDHHGRIHRRGRSGKPCRWRGRFGRRGWATGRWRRWRSWGHDEQSGVPGDAAGGRLELHPARAGWWPWRRRLVLHLRH